VRKISLRDSKHWWSLSNFLRLPQTNERGAIHVIEKKALEMSCHYVKGILSSKPLNLMRIRAKVCGEKTYFNILGVKLLIYIFLL
jgi:hypothetical protein